MSWAASAAASVFQDVSPAATGGAYLVRMPARQQVSQGCSAHVVRMKA